MHKEDILKKNQKTMNKEYDFFHIVYCNDVILFYNSIPTGNLLYLNNPVIDVSCIILSCLFLLFTYIEILIYRPFLPCFLDVFYKLSVVIDLVGETYG